MTDAITTPLTQALAEGKLSREELKTFMQHSDGPALRKLVLWVLVLAATTTLITLAWDSWLIWPAMFLQGIVLVHPAIFCCNMNACITPCSEPVG